MDTPWKTSHLNQLELFRQLISENDYFASITETPNQKITAAINGKLKKNKILSYYWHIVPSQPEHLDRHIPPILDSMVLRRTMVMVVPREHDVVVLREHHSPAFGLRTTAASPPLAMALFGDRGQGERIVAVHQHGLAQFGGYVDGCSLP